MCLSLRWRLAAQSAALERWSWRTGQRQPRLDQQTSMGLWVVSTGTWEAFEVDRHELCLNRATGFLPICRPAPHDVSNPLARQDGSSCADWRMIHGGIRLADRTVLPCVGARLGYLKSRPGDRRALPIRAPWWFSAPVVTSPGV